MTQTKPISIGTTIERSFIEQESSSTNPKMCPVVSIDLIPDGSPMKIKPVYRTFVLEEPIFIEVYADKGVTFAEFFIQAKDVKTNKTVGHWRIDDEQQEAYRCAAGKDYGLLDTVHWKSNGITPRKVVLDWVPSFTRDNIPDSIKFIGTFKTLTNVYEHTVSSQILSRKDLSMGKY